jgi:hypothetical protein
MLKNPFTPTFGNEPLVLAGREQLIDDITGGLENQPGDPNRATIFTGPRGSGKTVLLRKIESAAQQIGWISATTMTKTGMLKEMLEQTRRSAKEFLDQKGKSHITEFHVGGIGATRELELEDKSSWRLQMQNILDELREQSIGLLITIDEIDPESDELLEFVSDFQLFKSEDYDIAVVMAGLPENIDPLLQSKSVSFFRRAFRRELKAILISDVKESMRKTIEIAGRKISDDALETVAQKTEGFAFSIQLLGYHIWRQSEDECITMRDVSAGIAAAEEDMDNMVIGASVAAVSERDLEFLVAMAQDEHMSKISDVAVRMDINANLANQYRARLKKQGLIAAPKRGYVDFAMPMLKEYLVRNYA